MIGAALLEGAAPLPSPPTTIAFVAITRSAREAWLLDGSSGSLWQQLGEEPPVERVRLLRRMSPLSWKDAKGIAALADGWLIAGRKGRLERYSATGEFVREIEVKDRVADVVVSGPVLWAVPYIVPGPLRHLLLSADGETFKRLPLESHSDDVIGTGVAGVIDGAALLAADRDGGAVFVRVFGGPAAFRVRPNGSRRTVSLEYRRSARRDSLRRFEPREDDLENYSSPARDLLVTPDGRLVVLRNFEDVRTSDGVRPAAGTVIDLYAKDGRHEASAELSESARFIARTDGKRVVCVTSNGRILITRFGPRMKGGIE